jgi:hypothetical protein
MILIGLLGLALAAYAERSRPRPLPLRATLAVLHARYSAMPQRPTLPARSALPRRWAVPQRPFIQPRDPSVIIARPGIDDAMIHTVRQGIDDAMIVNPDRMARMPILTVPQQGNEAPNTVPPETLEPESWSPPPR